MGSRLYLSILCQVSAAMTARTIGQSRVTHHRWSPIGKAIHVASITFQRNRNMGHWLCQGILGDKGPVMATRTRPTHPDMAHLCRFECIEILVAATTLLRTYRYMAVWLAKRRCSVMASCTVTVGGGSMNKCDHSPCRG